MGHSFRTDDGIIYDEVAIVGSGACGPLTLAAAHMHDQGMPLEIVRDAVDGELAPDVVALVAEIRRRVVERSRGHPLCADTIDAFRGRDKRKGRYIKALQNPKYAIKTRALWEFVMGHPKGWVDGIFLLLGGEELALDFDIVVVREDNVVVPVVSRKFSAKPRRYMARWDDNGHFTLLVRKDAGGAREVVSGVVDSTSSVRDDITFGSFDPSMETETTTSGSYPPFDTDCARDDITFGSFGPSRTASAGGVTDATASDTDMTSCDAGDESAGEVKLGGVCGTGQILSLVVVVVSVNMLFSALRAAFAVAGELAQPVITNSTRGAAKAVGIFRDGVTSICRYIGGAALCGIGSASARVWTSMALTAVTESTIGSTSALQSRSSVAVAAVAEVSQWWEEEVETPLIDVGAGAVFTVRPPSIFRKCRVVRGRRYRPARHGGVVGISLPRKLATLLRLKLKLMSKRRSPASARGDGSMDNVAAALTGVTYLAIALAFCTVFGRVMGFSYYLTISSWIVFSRSLRSGELLDELGGNIDLASVRGGAGPAGTTTRSASGLVAPAPARFNEDGGTTSAAPALERPHMFWLAKMRGWKVLLESGEWSQAQYNKRMADSKDERENAEKEWLDEAAAKKEADAAEAAERRRVEKLACCECDELEDRPKGDELVLCDGDDCPWGACHMKCDKPNLKSVPRGDYLCPKCRERNEEHELLCESAATGENEEGDVAAGDGGADGDDGGEGGDDGDEGGVGGIAGGNGVSMDVSGATRDDGGVQGKKKSVSRKSSAKNKKSICAPKNKRGRLPLPSGRHSGLVNFGDDDKLRDQLEGNRKRARDLREEIRGDRAKADHRYLTLCEIKAALMDVDGDTGGDFDTAWKKLGKIDYRLYGITVMGRRLRGKGVQYEKGTKVRDSDGREGVVAGYSLDKETCSGLFTVQWGEKETTEHGLYDVLELAENFGDPDVVTIGDDKWRVRMFLRGVLCMVNVQVRRYTTSSENRVTRRRNLYTLPSESADRTMAMRKTAYEEIQDVSSASTMTPYEIKILESPSDPELVRDLEKAGSFFTMLGLDGFKDTQELGLVYVREEFHKRQVEFANHFIRGAQVAWKLGRPTSFESCLVPVSAGGVYTELPSEINCASCDRENTVVTNTCQQARECGLGVRALLVKARVGSVESGCYKWMKHFPLYRVFVDTRPDRIGKINAGTENTSHASQTRKDAALLKTGVDVSATSSQDRAVLKQIGEKYKEVANVKRSDASDYENGLKRVGNGQKYDNGRLARGAEWKKDLKFLGDSVEESVIAPFMDRIGEDAEGRDEVVKMCMEVLEDKSDATHNKNRYLGKRLDEDHLYPDSYRAQIDAVVGMFWDSGVDASDLASFSQGLQILDSLTAACLRPQDWLGCLASQVYVKGTRLIFVLPPECKNSEALKKSDIGLVVTHAKSDRTKGPYAVMMVIGRRLMRKHLEANYKDARSQVQKAQTNLADAVRNSTKDGVVKARKILAAAERQLTEYAPTESERKNEEDRAKAEKRDQREIGYAELGDKVCTFTAYGKNYDQSMLNDMYKYVGEYYLGLPAFGPNILRSIHVTDVMEVCYKIGIHYDDMRLVRHFALARHGEFERKRAYNGHTMDMVQDDPNSIGAVFAGILQSQDYSNRPLDKQGMKVAQEKTLKAMLHDSYDESGVSDVVGGAELFGDDPENLNIRREEYKKRMQCRIVQYDRSIESGGGVGVSPVDENDKLRSLRLKADMEEQLARIRVAKMQGRSGTQGVMQMGGELEPRAAPPRSTGVKRAVADIVLPVDKKPKKESENEYTERHCKKQEEKRHHLQKMNVLFNRLAREEVKDVNSTFGKGTLAYKLNREKGKPGCMFLPAVKPELEKLDADVCDGFFGAFKKVKNLYDFRKDHPCSYEWHLWHETGV